MKRIHPCSTSSVTSLVPRSARSLVAVFGAVSCLMSVPAAHAADEAAAVTAARERATALRDQMTNCGELRNAVGPFDYRSVPWDTKELVEKFHFSPQVEQLIKGESGPLGADLDYTLRVMPNHHRALASMARLGDRLQTETPQGSRYSVNCWFQRAMRFQPEDNHVKALYGAYLLKRKKTKDALAVLKEAAEDPALVATGQVNYNYGLALFQDKQYDLALDQAKIAYGAGVKFPALKQKLKSVGKSVD